MGEIQQVWKMPINGQRTPDFIPVPEEADKFEPGKAEKARGFCFAEGWVGIGWGIIGLNRDLTDHAEYLSVLEDTPESRLQFARKSARAACRSFAERMKEGDFVWCRAAGDTYWLGRVRGPWTYKHSGDFERYDLYQVRKCKWKCVGASDLVPGPVKNAYAGRGQAISLISREAASAFLSSALTCEFETGEDIGLDRKYPATFPLTAIAHDDLEDIVALYLQIEKGWHIIPSTVKGSTPTTEFVLRNAHGGRAYLQVKAGQTQIEKAEIPQDVDFFYSFYPSAVGAGDLPSQDAKWIQIGVDELTAFARSHRDIMPKFVQLLLERDTSAHR